MNDRPLPAKDSSSESVPSPTPRSGRSPSRSNRRTQKRKGFEQFETALDVLYRRKWIVLTVFLLAGVAAAAYAFTRVPHYTATSLIMIDLNRMPGGQDAMAVAAGTPFTRSDRSIASELFVLQNSRAISDRVNERMKEIAEERGRAPRGNVQFGAASRNAYNAIEVRATSASPRDAAALANAYAEEYVTQTQDASRDYFSSAREFLEQQAAEQRERLADAESRYEAFLERTGGASGIAADAGGNVAAQLASLEAQRDEARIDLQMQQRSLQTVEAELESANPRLVERLASSIPRELRGIDASLIRLEADKRQILDQAQGNPDARQRTRLESINSQIRDLENQKRELTRRAVSAGVSPTEAGVSQNGVGWVHDLQGQAVQKRIEIDGLQQRVSSMNQRIAELNSEMGTMPEQSTQLARLQRERANAEQMLQYVTTRLQETRISEGSEAGYAQVIRRAGVPSIPVGPDRWRHLGLGLILGLGLGLALAFGWDRLDNRLYKPEELRAEGHRVIGVIPDLKPHIKELYGKQETTAFQGREVSTDLVTLLDPASPVSESYRHLRTALQFSRPDVMVRTILVTSSSAGEGKSTTSSNLAAAIAQGHRRTIIVDADLRRPRLHDLFGVTPRSTALMQLLRSTDVPPTDVHQGIVNVGPNLDLLPADARLADTDPRDLPPVEDAADLVGSQRLRVLLSELHKHYDVVILDTSPVLVATDAVLLSTQADATLLVTAAGKTKIHDLHQTTEALEDVGAHHVGSILNGFNLSMAYGYRYSYSHYTRYGPYSSSYGYQDDSKKSRRARRKKRSAPPPTA